MSHVFASHGSVINHASSIVEALVICVNGPKLAEEAREKDHGKIPSVDLSL